MKGKGCMKPKPMPKPKGHGGKKGGKGKGHRAMMALALVFAPALAFAQDVSAAALDSLEGALGEAFSAAQRGDWTLAGILACVAFVLVARRYGPALMPGLASDLGGTLLAVVGTPLVALAGAGLAQQPLTRELVVGTFTTSALGATAWTVYRRAILKFLVPVIAAQVRRIRVVGPIAAAFIERPLGSLLDALRAAVLRKAAPPTLAASTSPQKGNPGVGGMAAAAPPEVLPPSTWGEHVEQGQPGVDVPPG